MKKSSVKYILCTLLVVCLITAEGIALYRHHQKASPQTAAPVTTSGPGSRTNASETPLPETTPATAIRFIRLHCRAKPRPTTSAGSSNRLP